jgi:hypothetical protein
MALTITFRDRTKSLCETCKNGMIARSKHSVYFRCSAADFLSCSLDSLEQPVLECSMYEYRYEDCSYSLKDRAWLLLVKGREIVGFVTPLRLRKPED